VCVKAVYDVLELENGLNLKMLWFYGLDRLGHEGEL
jgi:hypothetical protein